MKRLQLSIAVKEVNDSDSRSAIDRKPYDSEKRNATSYKLCISSDNTTRTVHAGSEG